MTHLFSRRTDTKRAKHSAAIHCRAFAHRLLDRAKAGHEVKDADIAWALRVTGDLPDSREPVSAWGLQVRREKEPLHE